MLAIIVEPDNTGFINDFRDNCPVTFTEIPISRFGGNDIIQFCIETGLVGAALALVAKIIHEHYVSKKIKIKIDGREVSATLKDRPTIEDIKQLIAQGPVTKEDTDSEPA